MNINKLNPTKSHFSRFNLKFQTKYVINSKSSTPRSHRPHCKIGSNSKHPFKSGIFTNVIEVELTKKIIKKKKRMVKENKSPFNPKA